MKRSILRRFDWVALAISLALVAVGLVMIYSTYQSALPDPGAGLQNLVLRQGLFAVIGLVAYFVAAFVDYRVLIALGPWIYLFIIAILAATLTLGEVAFGAQSWLETETFFDIQPSELCKVLMILVIARFLGRGLEPLESPKAFLGTGIMTLAPALLIYRQSDFGTALILVATWVGMVFLSGVRWRHILLVGSLGLAAAPLVWFQLEDYMRDRVLMFIMPDQDPSGASYNITQALISIGSGGWWGKGLLKGTQSQLYFLRVRHTDFIFSVLAEELGFIGATMLIALYAILILRLVRVAVTASDNGGRIVAAGVASMIFVQSIINLGMNANLMPVTGLPLPLVSYGGSSLVTTLLALGLAQSVAMRRSSPDATMFQARL